MVSKVIKSHNLFLDFYTEESGQSNDTGLLVGVHSEQGKRPYQEDEYAVLFLQPTFL